MTGQLTFTVSRRDGCEHVIVLSHVVAVFIAPEGEYAEIALTGGEPVTTSAARGAEVLALIRGQM